MSRRVLGSSSSCAAVRRRRARLAGGARRPSPGARRRGRGRRARCRSCARARPPSPRAAAPSTSVASRSAAVDQRGAVGVGDLEDAEEGRRRAVHGVVGRGGADDAAARRAHPRGERAPDAPDGGEDAGRDARVGEQAGERLALGERSRRGRRAAPPGSARAIARDRRARSSDGSAEASTVGGPAERPRSTAVDPLRPGDDVDGGDADARHLLDQAAAGPSCPPRPAAPRRRRRRSGAVASRIAAPSDGAPPARRGSRARSRRRARADAGGHRSSLRDHALEPSRGHGQVVEQRVPARARRRRPRRPRAASSAAAA